MFISISAGIVTFFTNFSRNSGLYPNFYRKGANYRPADA